MLEKKHSIVLPILPPDGPRFSTLISFSDRNDALTPRRLPRSPRIVALSNLGNTSSGIRKYKKAMQTQVVDIPSFQHHLQATDLSLVPVEDVRVPQSLPIERHSSFLARKREASLQRRGVVPSLLKRSDCYYCQYARPSASVDPSDDAKLMIEPSEYSARWSSSSHDFPYFSPVNIRSGLERKNECNHCSPGPKPPDRGDSDKCSYSSAGAGSICIKKSSMSTMSTEELTMSSQSLSSQSFGLQTLSAFRPFHKASAPVTDSHCVHNVKLRALFSGST